MLLFISQLSHKYHQMNKHNKIHTKIQHLKKEKKLWKATLKENIFEYISDTNEKFDLVQMRDGWTNVQGFN